MTRRIRKAPRWDPQRERLYAMENTFMKAYMNYVRMDLRKLKSIALMACHRYGVLTPDLRKGRGNKLSGQYDHFGNNIRLYARGLNPAVLLHEIAHHIVDHAFDVKEHHGATFAAVEMDLLNRFDVLPKKAFRLLAREYDIKIGSASAPDIKRRMLRRRKKPA